MSNVIDFYSARKSLNDDISLYDWYGHDSDYPVRTEEELRDVFLYMDMALKYIHDSGYYVYSFDPRNIILLDGKPDCVLYTIVMKLPSNMMERKKCVQGDIFLSACLQVGIYTNTLKHLNEDFLRDNFDEFAKHLPQGDVPYYRGVIVRNSAVYLCEFDVEKRKRDYESFVKEFEKENGKSSSDDEMINGANKIEFALPSNKNNEYIYQTIDKRNSNAAFVSYLLIPTIIITVGVAIGLLLLLIGAF